MTNPSRQHSKILYRWGVKRRGKIVKHGKVEVKRKWWVFAQPPYSLQGNRTCTQGGTRGIDHLMWRRTQGGTRGIGHLMWMTTQGAGIVKGWEDKRD